MAAPVIAPGAIAPLALKAMPHIFSRCSPQGAEPELDYLRLPMGCAVYRAFPTLPKDCQASTPCSIVTLCQPVVRDFCQKAMRSNVTKGGGPNLSEVAIVLVMLKRRRKSCTASRAGTNLQSSNKT